MKITLFDNIQKISLIIILGLAVVSCGGKSKEEVQKQEEARVFDVENCVYPDSPKDDAPNWVCNEKTTKYPVAAVGFSPKSKAGFAFMEQMAATNARVKLAQAMKVQVQNMTKQYIESIGGGEEETVDQVYSSVTQQITNETLVGSKIVKKITSPIGNFYVLVGLDESSTRNAVKKAVGSSINDEAALWQKFKAKQGQDDLANAISNQKL